MNQNTQKDTSSEHREALTLLADLMGFSCFALEEGKAPIPLGEIANKQKAPSPLAAEWTTLAGEKDVPILHTKDLKIFVLVFLCREKDRAVSYLSGPFAIRPQTARQLARYYEEMRITPGEDTGPSILPFPRLLKLAELEAQILGIPVTGEALMQENHLPETLLQDENLRDQVLFEMTQDREERAHHSYQEERYLLSLVREGKTREALQQNAVMDLSMGQMSKKETAQWRKTVVVAITLCTRAAIEGGVSPAKAYSISDYYLQKSDGCRTTEDLIACRNAAVRDLTGAVRDTLENRHTSSYVEKCRDYVRKHYKEKIYVGEIAEALGISETYLSRLFAKETGETLSDYIAKVRVEKAKNLLRYSDESIAAIASYVNFPSQSYFGRVFRKVTGMTPAHYRDRYKPAEFTEKEDKIR